MKLRPLLYTAGFISLYSVILLVIYVIHARYFRVDVVFYSALFDAIVALAITLTAFIFLTKSTKLFDQMHYVFLGMIGLLGGYAFAISVPTVLDRSLSFYIVEKIAQRGGGVRADALYDIFIDEFIPESRLMDIRMTEQLESATVTLDGDCLRLTEFGWTVAKTSRYLRTTFLPKKRKINDEYTDYLTDPFQNSDTDSQPYEC